MTVQTRCDKAESAVDSYKDMEDDSYGNDLSRDGRSVRRRSGSRGAGVRKGHKFVEALEPMGVKVNPQVAKVSACGIYVRVYVCVCVSLCVCVGACAPRRVGVYVYACLCIVCVVIT